MDDKKIEYTVFNPEKSRVATRMLKLSNEQPSQLIKRYLKRKSSATTQFFEVIQEEVNKVNAGGYLINPYLYQMEGENLNYVADQLRLKASKLQLDGYEFKLDNVARDLDRLFGEYAKEVDKITLESPIKPITQEITYFFINEIITNKVLKHLEELHSNSDVD